MLPCQGADWRLWTSDCVEDLRAAAQRCAPCPFKDECGARAVALGATWGAWGGKVRARAAARGNYCRKGRHEMTPENTGTDDKGYRQCLACKAARQARKRK